MLDQYIEQMWFTQAARTAKTQPVSPAVAAVLKAQQKAVDNADDFKFCVNIAVDKNNVERNPVNAANIWKYFDREIAPAWKKLDEESQLVCRLDWYGALYRAVAEIAALPHAAGDQASVQFVRALGLEKRWDEAYHRYCELREQKKIPAVEKAGEEASGSESAEAANSGAGRADDGNADDFQDFDRWLGSFIGEIVNPQDALWKKAEQIKGVQRFFSRTLGLIILCVILYVAGSYLSGYGYVAQRFNHEKMRAYGTQEQAEKGIEGFGTFEPIQISDFNASSIRRDGYGQKEKGYYSDRLLMDGDPTTAWEEGEMDAGINRRLYFNITGSAPVHYLVIWNGNQKDDDSYQKCNRLKDVSIRINDRMHTYRVTLKDQQGPQYVRIDRMDVDKLWIIINSVYEGTDTAGDNTAVSEVQIY